MLVVLCVLTLGMVVDASAQRRGRDWGRSHNRGNHYGWTRGRRVGQNRRDDSNWRRMARRDRRFERRQLRRERRIERRSDWNNRRDWRTSRNRQTGNWRRN
ncbi:MAG: hypothetical protein JOZ96_27425 [Acidobacteria bacterium]|nr:hypothetical protein [Acidobacteriota bacterium]